MTQRIVSLAAAVSTTQPMWDAVRSRTTWAQWAILLGAIFAGVVAGRIASALIAGVVKRLSARGWGTRASVIEHCAGPANLLLVTAGLKLGLFPLFAQLRARGGTEDPYAPVITGVEDFFARVIRLLFTLCLAWFLFNLVDTVDFILKQLAARTESTLDDQLAPLVRKTLRIFVVVVFALFIAQNVFGADITAWLAGLGIAGLAVSLAAQDSIKNLFGSITIFMDHPFAVGDNIKVGDFEGAVEEIGFRSTKLRGPTGNVVTIPNSKIVDGSVENVSRRPNLRRLLDVTVPYDTPPEKVRQAVELIRSILAEPDLAAAFKDMTKFPPRVYFDDMTADALRIRVIYWYYPATNWWGFVEHTQKFHLRLLEEFNNAGIEFSFPTRQIVLTRPKAVTHAKSVADDRDDAGVDLPGGRDVHEA